MRALRFEPGNRLNFWHQQDTKDRLYHWIGVDTQYRDRSTYGNVTRKDLTDEDLRRMRLGLGTALLLDDGYFGFDLGDGYHGYGEQWWFPEYDANLGFRSSNYEKAGDGTYKESIRKVRLAT